MKKRVSIFLIVLTLIFGCINVNAFELYVEEMCELEDTKHTIETVTGVVVEDAALSGGKGVQFTGVNGDGNELYTRGASPMGSLTVTVPVNQHGLYEIYVGVKKGPDAPMLQLNFQDINTCVGDVIDLYSPSSETAEIKIADQYLNMGNRSFRFSIVGKNPASTGLSATIDYVRIKVIGRYIAPAAEIPFFDDEQPTPATPDAPYTWGQVMESGTGRTNHLAVHPTEPGLMYLGTDMGGVYRWNPDSYTWTAITDIFPRGKQHYLGIESLALAESNPDIIYLSCGTDHDKGEAYRGEVIKSTDRGETWIYTGNRYLASSNSTWRGHNEALQVDPLDENILIYGTVKEGILRSTDGAQSFHPLTLPDLPEKAVPRCVWFDKSLNNGEKTLRVYISGADMPLYVSEDGGDTWKQVAGSPVGVTELRGANDGTLLVTASKAGLWTYKNGTWKNVTPVEGAAIASATIARNNSNYMITTWQKGPVGSYSQFVWYTIDGGANWKLINHDYVRNHTAPRLEWGSLLANVTSIEIDPYNPGRVFMGGWQNFYMTEDIFASPSVWTNHLRGIEHGVLHDMISMPVGSRLITSAYDYGGGRFTDVTQYMDKREPAKSSNSKMDFMETNPNFIVRISKGAGVYSTNSGIDWKYFDTWPAAFTGDICGAAISCDNNPETGLPVIVMMSGKVKPHVTFDLGKTWQEAEGIPEFGTFSKWNRGRHITADRVKPGVFYAHTGAAIYRSDDWGKTYSPILNDVEITSTMDCAPYVKGSLWVATESKGLLRSDSYGELFDKVGGFTSCRYVAFGKPLSGSSKPTVFALAERNGEYGVWKSTDFGESWQLILDQVNGNGPKAPIQVLEGDRQTENLVYVGTSGRGTWYGFPTGADNIFYSSRSDITVMINNQTVIFDVPPMIDGGRTMVPMRYICESMGAEVNWDSQTQSIKVKRHVVTDYTDRIDEVSMTVGSNIITVNGEEQTMDCAPMIVNGRTLVPARFIAQALGAEVNWNAEKRVVEIFV